MNQIEKMESLLAGALQKFDLQSQELQDLRDQISVFKGRDQMRIRTGSEGYNFRGVNIPWDDEKQAKNFCEFMRAVAKDDETKIRVLTDAMNEDTLETTGETDGGHLVPGEFKAVLLRIIEQYGVGRKECTIVPMSRDEVEWPTFDYSAQWDSGAGAVAGPVYWPDENTAITETWPQFGNVKMYARKLAALVPTSNELLQDSSIPLASLIATLVGEWIAKEEDRVIFVTSGLVAPTAFTGALPAASAGGNVVTMGSGLTSFTDMTAEHLLDMIDATPPGALNGAKFYMHRTIFHILRKLQGVVKAAGTNVGGDGQYIWQPPQAGDAGTIWGYPYEMIESFPGLSADAVDTPFVMFGNMKTAMYFGDKMALSVAASEQVGFAKFQTHFRFVERIAPKCAIPAALTTLETAAS
jgi:HK97 family phage major capsid protein